MNDENGYIGKFIPIDVILEKLSEIIYKSRFPNEVKKFTVDLSIARVNKKLSSIGGGEALFEYDVKYPTWHYLKILKKGTGTWTITFEMPGKRTISLPNDEVLQGDEIFLEFTELYFTNSSQTGVVSPVFWIEKRYFKR